MLTRVMHLTIARITLLLLLTCTITSCTTGSLAGQSDAKPGSVAADRSYPGDLSLPQRNDPWPGPETFTVGNAVSQINYWMTAWMLNDVFKMAGWEAEIGDTEPSELWVPVVAGEWRMDERDLVQTDELGWATTLELANGERADALVTIVMGGLEIPNAFPTGEYTLTWEGSGEILVEGATLVNEESNELIYEYDGTGTVIIYLLETDPADYVRNISMTRPDAVAGETFNREYIEYLKPFSVIRPLHFFGEQLSYGPPIAWEDRKPLAYSHWGGALGAPFEVGIDLANESVSDLWLNVPIAADDEFVRELAELTLERLDSNRKLYIELGNELWNFTDPYQIGRDYALSLAQGRWPGVLGSEPDYLDGEEVYENTMIFSWQGIRTVEIKEVFEEVWGSEADRIVTVLAGQIGGSHPLWPQSRDLLGCPIAVGEEGIPPCGSEVDAFAVAPYVAEFEGEVEFSRASPEEFLQDAITYVRGEAPWGESAEEPGIRYAIRNDKALADEYGITLVSYEGGQHFTGSSFTRDVVNEHPMLRDLYNALFNVWREEGGGLFVHLHGVIPRGQSEPDEEPSYFESENFGIKETQTMTRAEAPKWDAVLEWMERLGQVAR
ncbi:MAG: hypothetical protein ACLFM0_11095 [Spirochaetales bacterium]